MKSSAEKRRMDWNAWADFKGYGRPLADEAGRRMRSVLLYAQENVDDWIALEAELAALENKRALAYSKKRTEVEGSEAHITAVCTDHVVEMDCLARLLKARIGACKKLDTQHERAWETERSHGSGVKQESRATEAGS